MNLKKRSFFKKTVSHSGQISANPVRILVKAVYAANIFWHVKLIFRATLSGKLNTSAGETGALMFSLNDLISLLLCNASEFLSPDKNKYRQHVGISWMNNVGYTTVGHLCYISYR